jgi:hypothetical protein
VSIFKSILHAIAPTLASALPGPLGPLAKKAVTDLLGLDDHAKEEDIEAALAKASPETLQKLKQIEADFQVQMKKLDIDLNKLTVDDRGSARQRQIALRDSTPSALSWVICGSWVGITILLFFYTPPEANRQLLELMFAILTAMLKDVAGYWFGSSFGSEKKTEAMIEKAK